jgi:predicted MPP superfamily phosphohydrolase
MKRVTRLRGWRFVLGVSVFISIAFLLLFYTTAEGVRALSDWPFLSYSYAAFSLIFFALFVVSMVFIQKFPFPIAQWISILASPYFLWFVNLLLSTVLIDLIGLADSLLNFSSDNCRWFRKLWFCGSVIAIVALYVIGHINFRNPRIVNLTVDSPLPRQNRELKICLASDLHLGYLCDKKKFRGWVRKINAQHPDIVLLAGDLSDNFMSPIVDQNLCEEFDQIVARFGVIAVSGNHEYHIVPHDAFERYIRGNTKVKYLRDDVELVDGSVYVVGRDDKRSGNRLSIEKLVEGLDRSKPVIVLDHYPTDMCEAEANGITLALSGHTHRGQFFPVTLFVPFVFENYYGYRRRGQSQFYVSSGLGLWGPQCRFGSNSEIVNIKFRY